MNDKTLVPCPFCGGDDCIVTDQGDTKTYATYSIHQPSKYVPTCTDCGAEIHVFDTIDEAIAAWNTRAPQATRIEALEAALRPFAEKSAQAMVGYTANWAERMGKDYPIFGWNGPVFVLGDFLAAQQALEGSGNG